VIGSVDCALLPLCRKFDPLPSNKFDLRRFSARAPDRNSPILFDLAGSSATRARLHNVAWPVLDWFGVSPSIMRTNTLRRSFLGDSQR